MAPDSIAVWYGYDMEPISNESGDETTAVLVRMPRQLVDRLDTYRHRPGPPQPESRNRLINRCIHAALTQLENGNQ